jgi:hypothetical protein
LHNLILERSSLEIELDSLNSRLGFVTQFIASKVQLTHEAGLSHMAKANTSLTLNLPRIDLGNINLLQSIASAKSIRQIKIADLRNQIQDKEKKLTYQLDEEDQSLSLILACIDGLGKTNQQLKAAIPPIPLPSEPIQNESLVIIVLYYFHLFFIRILRNRVFQYITHNIILEIRY